MGDVLTIPARPMRAIRQVMFSLHMEAIHKTANDTLTATICVRTSDNDLWNVGTVEYGEYIRTIDIHGSMQRLKHFSQLDVAGTLEALMFGYLGKIFDYTPMQFWEAGLAISADATLLEVDLTCV